MPIDQVMSVLERWGDAIAAADVLDRVGGAAGRP
jgi:hypothetical protein